MNFKNKVPLQFAKKFICMGGERWEVKPPLRADGKRSLALCPSICTDKNGY